MHKHDILRVWVAGITKTGSEQEQVDRLADVLDGLLTFPKAKELAGYEKYEMTRQNARADGYAGVDTLADTLIDLSCQLER